MFICNSDNYLIHETSCNVIIHCNSSFKIERYETKTPPALKMSVTKLNDEKFFKLKYETETTDKTIAGPELVPTSRLIKVVGYEIYPCDANGYVVEMVGNEASFIIDASFKNTSIINPEIIITKLKFVSTIPDEIMKEYEIAINEYIGATELEILEAKRFIDYIKHE